MNALALAAAGLVSTAAAFHQGLECLEKKQHDKAAAHFTEVIQAQDAIGEMREYSFLYRAQAHAAADRKQEGLKDLESLLRDCASTNVRVHAVATYEKMGGDLKGLRPKDSPSETFAKILECAAAGEEAKARQQIGGPLRNLMDMMDTFISEGGRRPGRTYLTELARERERWTVTTERIHDTNGTATLSLNMQGTVLTLGLVQQGGAWVFSSVEAFGRDRPVAMHGGGVSVHKAMTTLSQIGKALAMYAMDHDETFPAKLEDLSKYLGDRLDLLVYADPETGKREVFLYRPGLRASSPSETLAAATPFPSRNSRTVLRVDGSVTAVAENDFVRLAADQGWVLPGSARKEDVAADARREIEGLVRQLGDADGKARAAARRHLKEFGAAARPFLEDQRNNDDPEVRMAVRELLGGPAR